MTGYLLLLSDRPKEACEFLLLAEKIVNQLNETSMEKKSSTSTQEGRLDATQE
jgi:hypothetical protein